MGLFCEILRRESCKYWAFIGCVLFFDIRSRVFEG